VRYRLPVASEASVSLVVFRSAYSARRQVEMSVGVNRDTLAAESGH
jgi:hypothetical protein